MISLTRGSRKGETTAAQSRLEVPGEGLWGTLWGDGNALDQASKPPLMARW